jgi:L,D-transpeptidase YcbB
MSAQPYGLRSMAVLATAGLVVAILVTSAVPVNAGPFSWLTGKNNNQGSGGGFFGGNRGLNDPTNKPGASELPANDPEAYMITNPALGTPTLSSRNIAATKAAIEQYKGIVAQGGWPMIPPKAMKPGMRGQDVATLQRRLEISGDLRGRSIQGEYDAGVVAAVKKFQARHGLPPTGVIDSKAMVEALNMPASFRLAQLQTNMKRLQRLSAKSGSRYVVVNIPSAQVEAVDSGQVIMRNAVVVGKMDRPTPELSSRIVEINFNPYWNVPRSIVQKDLVPKGRLYASQGKDMLAAYRMQAFDRAGNPVHPQSIDWNNPEVYNYSFRQLPWEENSLGFVKINFPNKDAVYLHDTPLKGLFASAVRFESSGCVRVHNVERLVAWILRSNPGWDINRIHHMKVSKEQLDVKVASPVPVHLTYVTAWGTPDGQVQFRPDIYGHDSGAVAASTIVQN